MAAETGLATSDRQTQIEAARDAKTVVPKMLLEDLIREVGTIDGGKIQRWVVRVPLSPKHQYLIPGARRNKKERGEQGPDRWVGEYSAGIRAEGYDHLNRVAGIRFFTPPTVHGRDGTEVANPIHARDYLYHREIGQGYSETGQMVLYVEDIEIDFQQAWEAERLKALAKLTKKSRTSSSSRASEPEMGGWGDEEEGAAPATAAPAPAAAPTTEELIVRDENGMPKQGPRGELLFRLPQAEEVAAMQRIVTLRNFGGRQAKTIARRRILETALGLRTLWMREEAHRPELETAWVWVTGWRDQLTPDEAWEKAQQEQTGVFGAPIGQYTDNRPVEDGEFRDAEDEVEVEQTDPAVEAQVAEVTDEKRAEVKAAAEAGIIPGVTRGMPGEKLAKAICGERDVIGPSPCTRAPRHGPTPHSSEDGVWPVEVAS